MEMQAQKNSFRLSYGFQMHVDFCVWILEQDGLQVPPFDLRPKRDGQLQAAGLQATEWQQWFSQVVTHPDQNPMELWVGDPQVKSLLEQKWIAYTPISHERGNWEAPLARIWSHELSPLWQELAQHAPSAQCDVSLVLYSKPLEYLVPPHSAVVSVPYGYLESDAFRTALLRIVQTLFPSRNEDVSSRKDRPLVPPSLSNDDLLHLERRFQIRQRVLDELRMKGPGAVKIGVVEHLTAFGAVVDLDGMDMNVPTANFALSDGESITPGQKVEVRLLKISGNALSFAFKLLS